jgi:hypothetical protein
VRVLFVMHYPGYLRYYDSTVHELASRGHDVLLSFDVPAKQCEGLAALAGAAPRVEVLGRTPNRGDSWEFVAQAVRRVGDYLRYLHPRFAEAQHLRRRQEHNLPGPTRLLGRLPVVGSRTADAGVRLLLACEAAIPPASRVGRFLDRVRPDVVVVSPLVNDVSRQTDVIKSAQARGIPTVLAVASWDHLTTKGLIRVLPDRVLVWNEVQRDEAVELHGVPGERVVVTGAQPFDRWFDRAPSTARGEFCAKVGLPEDHPIVLFVGSTASISAPDAEVEFVRRWVTALRKHQDERLREVAVLVRPHPYNSAHWRSQRLHDLSHCALWPRDGANPVDDDDRADYFDSLHHSAAVVGVNTSAMIEAAIVGRPVLTVQAPEFAHTQMGTLHFRYLVRDRGGFVRSAQSLDEHMDQLGETLAGSEAGQAEATRFVTSFIRPRGRHQPCTPQVAEAIEGVATVPVEVRRRPRRLYPLGALVWALGMTRLAFASPDRRRRVGRRLRRSTVRRARRALARKRTRARKAEHAVR